MSPEPATHPSHPPEHDERRQPESYAWPLLTLAVVIVPQIVIPVRDRVGPPLLVPLIEAVGLMLMVLIAARPGPVEARARPVVLSLFGVMVVANAVATGRLVALVLDGGEVDGHPLSAGRLLVAGGLVLSTNIVTFGLVYWQIDSGGPSARARGPAQYPDFEFPQTVTVGLAAPGWQPRFGDHLYVAFTNVVAFSPTDTAPLTLRAKGLMALQSLISLAVLVVVLARVINILPT